MKTDCEFFDECRKPVQACTSRCPEYKKRNASGSKLADANVGEQKAGSSRSRKE
jgi:hypothetical protein